MTTEKKTCGITISGLGIGRRPIMLTTFLDHVAFVSDGVTNTFDIDGDAVTLEAGVFTNIVELVLALNRALVTMWPVTSYTLSVKRGVVSLSSPLPVTVVPVVIEANLAEALGFAATFDLATPGYVDSTLQGMTSDYAFCPILSKVPDEVSRTVDLDGGRQQVATQKFVLGMDIRDNSTIPERVVAFLTSRKPRAFGRLDETDKMDETESPMTYEPYPGEVQPVQFDHVFLQREAMVALFNPGAPIDTDGDGHDEQTLSISRGEFGTLAGYYIVDDLHDRQLYTSNPFVKGREVTEWEFNLDGTGMVEKWHGLIESVEYDGGVSLTINCTNTMGYLPRKGLGEGRPYIYGHTRRTTASGVSQTKFIRNMDDTRVSFEICPVYYDSQINEYDYHVVLRVGDVIIAAPATQYLNNHVPTWAIVSNVVPVLSGDVQSSKYSESGTEEPKNVLCWEVLTTCQEYSHFKDSAGAFSDSPFDIIRNILCSTGAAFHAPMVANGDYDCLPRHWGLAIPDSLIDHDSFDTMKTTEPFASLRMENLVIGSEKNPEGALDVISSIAKQCWCFIGQDWAGRITIGSFKSAFKTVAVSVDEDSIIENSFQQVSTSWKPVNELRLMVSKWWPSNDFRGAINNVDLAGSYQAKYRSLCESKTIELSYFGNYNEVEITNTRVKRAIIDIFGSYYRMLQSEASTYQFIIDSGATLNPGELISLTKRGVITSNVWSAIEGITAHECLVLDCTRSRMNGTTKVTVLDLSSIFGTGNNLAPAWKVLAWDAVNSKVQIAKNEFISPTDQRYPYGDWDLAYFSSVQLCTWAGVPVVGAGIGSGHMEYAAGNPTGWVHMTTPWGVAPVAGNIIRLSDYGLFFTHDSTHAFIANTSGVLVGATEPKRWGI